MIDPREASLATRPGERRGTASPMSVRHVVFDIGNVLLDWSPAHLYGPLFAGRTAAMTWFLDNICTPDWNLAQDGGRSWNAGVTSLVTAFPEWRSEIDAFDRRWHEMIPGPISGSVAILEALHRQGVRLFAITNFSSAKYAESVARFPFFALFEGVVVSAHERLLKPDAAIFRCLADRHGIALADCVFIDDNAANVEGARAVGMLAHRFTTPAGLQAFLEEAEVLRGSIPQTDL